MEKGDYTVNRHIQNIPTSIYFAKKKKKLRKGCFFYQRLGQFIPSLIRKGSILNVLKLRNPFRRFKVFFELFKSTFLAYSRNSNAEPCSWLWLSGGSNGMESPLDIFQRDVVELRCRILLPQKRNLICNSSLVFDDVRRGRSCLSWLRFLSSLSFGNVVRAFVLIW